MAKKKRTGKVLKNTNDKTAIVGISWVKKHRIYKKGFKRTTKLVVHDPENFTKVGDVVKIEETRPMSATKRWRILEILRRESHKTDNER